MGIYTLTNKTFGLYLSPRLIKIIGQHKKGEKISERDLNYLIDAAGRHTTMVRRFKTEKYMIPDMMGEDKWELREVLGDMFDELTYLYPSKVGLNNNYRLELKQFRNGQSIENMSADKIVESIQDAIQMVKNLQHSFDENGDNVKVEGIFPGWAERYKIDIVVTAETKIEDILPVIIEKMKNVIEKERKEKELTEKVLDKIRSEWW